MKLEEFMKKIEHERSAIEILRLKNQYFTEKESGSKLKKKEKLKVKEENE